MRSKSNDTREALLLYDGECPFCKYYVNEIISLKEKFESVRLINARESDDPFVQRYRSIYNLNDGFLFILNNKEYYGPDAIHALSLLKSGNNILSPITNFILSSKPLAKLLYPFFVVIRKTYFFLIGKDGIRN